MLRLLEGLESLSQVAAPYPVRKEGGGSVACGLSHPGLSSLGRRLALNCWVVCE